MIGEYSRLTLLCAAHSIVGKVDKTAELTGG